MIRNHLTLFAVVTLSLAVANPATADDGGAKTPKELVRKLVTAFGKIDKEAFIANFHIPDDITRQLSTMEVDKAMAFARIHHSLAIVNKRLGDGVFDREKFKDRSTFSKWQQSYGSGMRTWLVLLQPQNIQFDIQGDKGTVNGTYKVSRPGMSMTARGDFRIIRVKGKWYVDNGMRPNSVLRRMPQKVRDQHVKSWRPRVDATTALSEAFEKLAPKITHASHVAPAIAKAVEAKEKVLAEKNPAVK